jgi:chorismate mutase-like protein
MDISDWRKKIDEIDGRIVELLSARARAAHEIGRLKRDRGMPIYEPDREQAVLKHIAEANPGPLSGRELVSIYERIMDIMRLIQQEEIAPEAMAAEDAALPTGTEIDPEVND